MGVHGNTQGDAESDVKSNVKSDVESDVKSDVESDVKSDAESDRQKTKIFKLKSSKLLKLSKKMCFSPLILLVGAFK